MNKKLFSIGVGIVAVVVVVIVIMSLVRFDLGYGRAIPPFLLFEVHEWGVFQQEYNTTIAEAFAGPISAHPFIPDVSVPVLKPIIYFHSQGKGNVSINVTLDGKNIVTIPEAEVDNNVLHWDIEIADDGYKFDDSAVIITKNGKTYEYLFYEGGITRPQELATKVKITDEGLEFNITNNAAFEMYDIFFGYRASQDPNNNLIYIYLPMLGVNESKVITTKLNQITLQDLTFVEVVQGVKMYTDSIGTFYKEYKNLLYTMVGEIALCKILDNGSIFYESIKHVLVSKGLTELEADDMIGYWSSKWFPVSGESYSNIVYFLPQTEYDAILPISVDPESSNIVRVGAFFIRNIPIQ